jgi:hypothetical protein
MEFQIGHFKRPLLLNVLPDELWLAILNLFSPDDLLKVGRVCKKFHSLSLEPSLRRTLYITTMRTATLALGVVDRCTQLYDLTINHEAMTFLIQEKAKF